MDGEPSAPRPTVSSEAGLPAVRVSLYDTTLHPPPSAPRLRTVPLATASADLADLASTLRDGAEQRAPTTAAPLGPDAQSVWSNLAAIFKDIDKGGRWVCVCDQLCSLSPAVGSSRLNGCAYARARESGPGWANIRSGNALAFKQPT
jgi:hypothetical protein